MRALDRKLLRDLWYLKTQVLAIAVVMAAGISTFVMSLGMLDSLKETRAAYYERQRFAQVFAHVKRAPTSLEPRIAAIPGVAAVETRIALDVLLDVAGVDEPATGRLLSLPVTREPTLNLPYLRRGRDIEPGRNDEVIVNEAFALAHGFEPGDRVGAIINGRKRDLQIVGIALSPEFVYAIPPGGIFPDDKRFGVLWMARAALEAAADLDGAFNEVSLSLMASASEPEIIARLDDLLATHGGFGAFGRADHLSDWYVSGEMDQLRAMAIMSPLIFLSVTAFLFNVVISRLIATEREQIGTMKALGYSGLEIAWHYSKLTLTMVAIGVGLGVAAGIWFGRDIADTYTRFYHFPILVYELSPQVLVAAAAISCLSALAGTMGALRQAVALPAAEAMQPAPPTVYGRTLVERLGLQRLFRHGTRMILRHIERRPVRSLLSSLGIAAGVAVMIAAMFALDSIDYILRVQFNIAQRQHMTVNFFEPRPWRALSDMAHQPGVLRAEPFRAVATRLVVGNRSKRIGLMGLMPDAELNRMIDAALRPLAVPDQGIMLSAMLADMLGVGRGDEVTVEVLEGRRPVATVRVAGTFEEFIGTSAFTSLPALNALLSEGPTISGAYLLTDSAAAPDLYRRLKNTPAVAGLAMRDVAIRTFRETLAENMSRMIFFNVLFAGLIAFGVVYNSARIALSERARELASLRVLGFGRWETSYLLLGELALLTLPALPAGCALGYGLAWLISLSLTTELYRIPLIVDLSTFGFAVVVVLIAVILSSLIVRRRLDQLDLVATIKARE